MPVRKIIEGGMDGIADEYKEMYEITNDGVYVSINNDCYIPVKKIIRVLESETDYEIQTRQVYVNLSKTDKMMKILVRM